MTDKISLKVLGQKLMDAALADSEQVVEYTNGLPTLMALRMECYRLRSRLRDAEDRTYDKIVICLKEENSTTKLQFMVKQ